MRQEPFLDVATSIHPSCVVATAPSSAQTGKDEVNNETTTVQPNIVRNSILYSLFVLKKNLQPATVSVTTGEHRRFRAHMKPQLGVQTFSILSITQKAIYACS